MYTEFFGLRELPFNNTPDPRFFYSTPDHEEALASLIYAVKQRKGFVLLTGEVGAGKTLVSRMMLRHFGTGIAFANINHTLHSAGDLMESLCTEFELPVEPDMSHTLLVRALHDFLLTKFAQNVPVVLILDEAQNLPIVAFEQLRMIGNLEADDAKLLQIAIVGQPELQRLFQSPQLRQLKQRVFRSFHLPALDRKATEGYIRYRLSVAASNRNDLFSSRAVDRIFEVSRGLPRLINTLCDNAMLSAYSADVRRIDTDLVESVVSQMMVIGQSQSQAEPGTTLPPPPTGWPGQPAASPMTQPYGGGSVPYQVDPRPPTPYPQAANPWEIARGMPGVNQPAIGAPGVYPQYFSTYGYQPRQYAPALPAPPPPVPLDESVRLRQELRTRLTSTMDRIRAFERRSGRFPARASALARTTGGSDPTIRGAESILGRIKTASQDLNHREKKLHNLSRTVRTVAGELTGLLDRLQKASSQSRREERSAGEIHERLVQQTEQARKVAVALERGTPNAAQAASPDETGATVIKTASASKDATIDTGESGKTVQLAPGPLQRDLTNTRESLSELRKLARSTGDSGNPDTDNPIAETDSLESTATDRLAHHVKDLVAMLDS